jgi:hypothetical protein
MSKIIRTYTDRNGSKFNLQEFDNSRIYREDEKRQIKSSNADYYSAIAQDEKAAEFQAEQAKKPKLLTEEEVYQLRVKEQAERDAEAKKWEAQQEEKQRMHQAYLDSSPAVSNIMATNLHTLALELIHWGSKGYTLLDDSLNCAFPSYFSASLAAPAPKGKK